MQSLKGISLFFAFLAPIFLWSQIKPTPYIDMEVGGPSSVRRVPGPSLETGILFTPHIGVGLRWETEPFATYFHHGIGAHLRLSTQTSEGKGWYLSLSTGGGQWLSSSRALNARYKNQRGYLFSAFSLGRHLNRRVIFSSGIRTVEHGEDPIFNKEPSSHKLLISKFTFVLGNPAKSPSPALARFNKQTYFFGMYSVNTRLFDDFRVNGMVNLGAGWKISPMTGLGLSLILNEGLSGRGFTVGSNLDKLAGIGAHVFVRQNHIWGMLETGAAMQVTKGRSTSRRSLSFIYKQHTKATTLYSRISGGIFINKNWLAQVSFLIAPAVYGDAWFPIVRTFPPNGPFVATHEDLYFSFTDLNFGIGFLID